MCVSVSVSRLVPPGPVLLSQHPVERSETKLPLQSFTVGCFRHNQRTLVLRKTPLWLRTAVWSFQRRMSGWWFLSLSVNSTRVRVKLHMTIPLLWEEQPSRLLRALLLQLYCWGLWNVFVLFRCILWIINRIWIWGSCLNTVYLLKWPAGYCCYCL